MPAVIALILRQIIMAIATGAIVTGAQEVLDGTARELVAEIKDSEGVTEQDAKDIVGNILIDLAVNSVTIFTVLKTGAGVKAAEWLGLTARGFAKKKLIYPASTVAAKVAGPWEAFKGMSLVSKVLTSAGLMGTLTWLGIGFANVIEAGIYKPREANDQWERFTGIRPFAESPASLKPGPFSTTSSTTFADFAKSIEAAGVTGIEDPVRRQSVPYDRETLAALVDYIYGTEVLKGSAPSVKQLLPLISPYLVGASVSVSPAPSSSTSVSIAPIPKVFTGIVSQGIVGEGLTFTPRPDDMIESAAELRQAAANNLVPYLNALLGKIVYEVKVVPSVITKDGFKQTGTTQQIKTGAYANGQPKYKTVTNKFATLIVYAVTDKGSRAKLTTIVLGPTNSAKLTVAQNDLRALESTLSSEIATSDIDEITGISTSRPLTVTTPKDALAASVPAPEAASVAGASSSAERPTSVSTGAGRGATTLSAWYQAQGQALPSVAERANLYEELELGKASYYTGTAEQNTKLLDALKYQSVPMFPASSGGSKDDDKDKEDKKEDTATKPKVSASEQKKLDALGKQIADAQKQVDALVKSKNSSSSSSKPAAKSTSSSRFVRR